MARFISVALLLISICLEVNGQNYFNKRYDFYGFHETAFSVVENDSQFLAAGAVYDSTGFLRIGVLGIQKVDGTPLFTKSFGGNGHWYPGISGSFIKTSDGGYALGGSISAANGNSRSMLIKFNSSLDTSWTRVFGDTAATRFEAFYNCKQTSDGGFILIGFSDSIDDPEHDILLLRTDSLGNLLWKKYYGLPVWNETGYSVNVLPDGGFIIGAGKYGTANNYRSYIIRTDSMGVVLWENTYGTLTQTFGSLAIATQNGGFAFCTIEERYTIWTTVYTNILVYKLTALGDTIWTRNYGYPNQMTDLSQIHELNDGSLVVIGQTQDTSFAHTYGFMLKLNKDGAVLWFRLHDVAKAPYSRNSFRDFKPTADGGFICVGTMLGTNPDPPGQDMWVIKLDSLGCDSLGGCIDTGFEDQAFALNSKLNIYPNPSSGEINLIVPDVFKEKEVLLEMFDLTGRIVFTLPIHAEATTFNPILHPGIYFLIIRDRTGSILGTGKLIRL